MTYKEIAAMIESIGLPYAYYQFPEGTVQEPPFVVFFYSNIDDLYDRAPDVESTHKIHKMTDYCTRHTEDYVPDPYYGGRDGFFHVIELLEDACEGLLNSLK